MSMSDRKTPMPDATMPSRNQLDRPQPPRTTESLDVPWFVRQFLNGEGDLHSELAQRYPNQPLLSLIHVRNLTGGRGIASLSAQDGAASLIVEIDLTSHSAQFSYTLASMLTLRFDLVNLTDADRGQWLEQMASVSDRAHILWGKLRWRADYMIWSRRQHYTNVYAFSAHHTEAVVRLTPDVARVLIDWMQQHWSSQPQDNSAASSAW